MTPQDKLFLKEIQKNLKVRFNNLDLLLTSLSHKSFVNERQKDSIENNEKLEFLGDSVLGLIITEYLYNKYPDLNEGDMARIKSVVVSEDSLSAAGRRIGLNNYLRIGKGEELTGGRDKKALIADAFEAFLGAIYLDSKYSKVEGFVIELMADEIDLVVNERQGMDYKTLLQEFVQKKYKDCPKYRLISESGPEHDKTFNMEVIINDNVVAYGSGKTKKEAEKEAAQFAYNKLNSVKRLSNNKTSG